MSFQTLSRIIKRPTNERYILQKKKTYAEDIPTQTVRDEVGNVINKDEIGNIKETWENIQELSGVIQHRQYEKQRNRVLSITNAGEESTLRYYGYFNPTFELITDALADYRIKFVRPHEIIYLKIIEYDPNNYLRDDHHHIVLGMERDRKYHNRQRGKKDPNMIVNIPESVNEGEDVDININFPDDAVGDVVINNRYRIPIENSIASTTLHNLPIGVNNIYIKFLGDEEYNEILLKYEVLVKTHLNIIVSDVTKYYNGSERLYVKVLDSNNSPVNNAKVVYESNDISYKRVTKEDGVVSIGLNFSPGTYNFSIKVNDQETTAVVDILSTIKHTNTKIFSSGKKYFASFLDNEGNYLPKNTSVEFLLNNRSYKRKISTNDGIAFLNTILEDGNYHITSHNIITDENLSNDIVIENNDNIIIHASDIDIFITDREDKFFNILITDENNIPLSNQQVNLVLYSKQTNKDFKQKIKFITDDEGKGKISLKNCIYTGVYGIIITSHDTTIERNITVLDNY